MDSQMGSVSKCSSVLMYSQNARSPLCGGEGRGGEGTGEGRRWERGGDGRGEGVGEGKGQYISSHLETSYECVCTYICV